MPTTSGTNQTFRTVKTLTNLIPFKSLGVYSTLSSFCAPAGTAGLANQYFDPLYLKGSALQIYSITENKLVEIVPTFNYFEVAQNGEITNQGATEPAAIAIAGTACTNFVVGVYLKYKMSKDGVPQSAIFLIYYKTTQTFAAANILSTQIYEVGVRGDRDFE